MVCIVILFFYVRLYKHCRVYKSIVKFERRMSMKIKLFAKALYSFVYDLSQTMIVGLIAPVLLAKAGYFYISNLISYIEQ